MAPKNIKLTESQQRALDQMKHFVDESDDRVFVLKGYAGTGKTTLMKFLIEHLRKFNVTYCLLSTTGRAAKILSNYTGEEAKTIHSMIYSYKDFNKDMSDADVDNDNVDSTGQLFLVFEPSKILAKESRTVYIIDESSMISDTEVTHVMQAQFGTGRLLMELLAYDERKDSKFVFVGDPCQLPPVNGTFSPAMDAEYVAESFGYGVQEASLSQIMRQSGDCSIVKAASVLRSSWAKAPADASFYGNGKVWGMFPIRQYPDVHLFSDMAAMQQDYVANIRKNGYNDSVMICRSNADCQRMSTYIRQQLGFSGGVQKGDLLMVVQNQMTTGLMNGDLVEVVEVSPKLERSFPCNNHKGYRTELNFREIKVKELFSGKEITTLLIENTVNTMQNNLDSRMQTGLFLDFIIRMKSLGITQRNNRKKFNEAMYKDPYLNALRCSYGYAITCHKAQGGEWNKVYIHIGARNFTLNPTKGTYQWLYTALTRGKKSVYLLDDFYIR